MTTLYDVPASKLIEKLARYLKDNVDEISPPSGTIFLKTGQHAQRPPEDRDWWFVRCASLMRKVGVHGPMGVERLRSEYGGRKDHGVSPEHAAKTSGSIIRRALQQLQKAGLVDTKSDGRRVTRKGRRLLDEVAEEVKKSVVREIPELAKY